MIHDFLFSWCLPICHTNMFFNLLSHFSFINKAPPWGRSSTSAGLGSPYVDLQGSSICFEQVLAHAFIKRHMHVPMCMWGTWHVVTHVEETHMESQKEIWVDSVFGTYRNSTLNLLLSCSWASVTSHKSTRKQNPKRLVEQEHLAARSLKIAEMSDFSYLPKIDLSRNHPPSTHSSR